MSLTPFAFLRNYFRKRAIAQFLSQDSADFVLHYADLLAVCRKFMQGPITLKEVQGRYFESQYTTLGRINHELAQLLTCIRAEDRIRFNPDTQEPQRYSWYLFSAGSQSEIVSETELWLDLFDNLEQLCLIVQETESETAGYYEHVRRVIYMKLLKTEIVSLLEELQTRL